MIISISKSVVPTNKIKSERIIRFIMKSGLPIKRGKGITSRFLREHLSVMQAKRIVWQYFMYDEKIELRKVP